MNYCQVDHPEWQHMSPKKNPPKKKTDLPRLGSQKESNYFLVRNQRP
jgi:hypothetical protein